MFSGYRILGWHFLSFSTWKMCHLLLASMDFDKKTCCHSKCLSPINNASFLFCCFQDFFFVFSFQMFDYDVSWHRFWGFVLFRVHSVSWICKLRSFGQIFRKFRKFFNHYFFEYFLISAPFLDLSKTLVTQPLDFLYSSTSPWFYIHFIFLSILSLLFRLSYFYCSIFKSMDCFLCFFSSAIEPIHWLLVWLLYFIFKF